MFLRQYIQILLLIILFGSIVSGQQSKDREVEINPCLQKTPNTFRMIKNDKKSIYRIKQIEIWGNIYISDREIRKELKINEGDIFEKKSFDEAIKNINKTKKFGLLSQKDVRMTLDVENKDLYMVFCVNEKMK